PCLHSGAESATSCSRKLAPRAPRSPRTRNGTPPARAPCQRSCNQLCHWACNVTTGPVYVVWDNLNVHTGKRWEDFNERHGGRFHFLYTPKHASWVNCTASDSSGRFRRVRPGLT